FPTARAAIRRDLHFHALWQGSPVGEHRVAFGMNGDRLTVETHVDITIKVLFFTVFRLRHSARETWRFGRLESVSSVTDRDGTRLEVSGSAVENGFRIVGVGGPFLGRRIS